MTNEVLQSLLRLLDAQQDLQDLAVKRAHYYEFLPSTKGSTTLEAGCRHWTKPHLSSDLDGNQADTIPGIICVSPSSQMTDKVETLMLCKANFRNALDALKGSIGPRTELSALISNAIKESNTNHPLLISGVWINIRQLVRQLLVFNDVKGFALRPSLSYRTKKITSDRFYSLLEGMSDDRQAYYERLYSDLSLQERSSLRYFFKKPSLRYQANIRSGDSSIWGQYHVASPVLSISSEPPMRVRFPSVEGLEYEPSPRFNRCDYTSFIPECHLYVQQ
jgi:hypothetical protein